MAVISNVLLDGIRNRYGDEQLREKFLHHYKNNPQYALLLLNDEALSFPSLFILQPEIKKLSLEAHISEKNMRALELARQLASRSYTYQSSDYAVLKWMFQTGYQETHFGDEYDTVMDFAAIILLRENHDKECLSPLEEMIFLRNAKGLNTYDAEWAFFESRETDCLLLLANRLRSPNPKDAELSRRLLNFIPCLHEHMENTQKQYDCVVSWINENKPYLIYTCENTQKGCKPCPYKISLEAKYLQRPLDGEGAVQAMSYNEHTSLYAFSELEPDTKELLSEYSGRLHKYNSRQWKQWMLSPLPQQIERAQRVADRRGGNG